MKPNSRRFPGFLEEWRLIGAKNFTPMVLLEDPAGFPFVVSAQWLYVPDFVEYRGGVFSVESPQGLTEARRKTLDDWFTHYHGAVSSVERIGNLIEFWEFFRQSVVKDFDEEIAQTARSVRDSWDALLKSRFPEREFVVEFLDDNETGPRVTFFTNFES